MGITAYTPHSNRTCAINAYGLTLYFNVNPCINWLSNDHTIVLCIHIRSCYPFDFLSCFLNCMSYLRHWGDNRISAVLITYLSSTSPSSQTGGCQYSLTNSDILVLPTVNKNTSTISNLIIISLLNHFTFVSALLLPVLRLSLSLPFRLQGLGTGG